MKAKKIIISMLAVITMLLQTQCNSTYNLDNLGNDDKTKKSSSTVEDIAPPVTGGPDLVITNVSHPDVIAADENFIISLNIKNNGDSDLNSGYSVDLYYIDPNATGPGNESLITSVMSISTPLAAGTYQDIEPSNHTIQIPASLAISTLSNLNFYKYKLKITPNQPSEEPVENQANNQFISSETFQLINKSDLVVSNVSIVASGGTYSMGYAASIENSGVESTVSSAGASDFTVKYYLTTTTDKYSSLVTGSIAFYQTYKGKLDPISSGGSTIMLTQITLSNFGFNGTTTLLPTGGVYLQVEVDSNREQSETNENNNFLSMAYEIQAGP